MLPRITPRRRVVAGTIAVVGALAAAWLTFQVITQPSAVSTPPAVATFEVAGVETFKVALDRPDLVEHARALLDGSEDAPIPNGVVVRDSPGVNAPWHWHLDPRTLEFADFTTEVCDGLPSDIEAGVVTSGRYCPWSATVVALED